MVRTFKKLSILCIKKGFEQNLKSLFYESGLITVINNDFKLKEVSLDRLNFTLSINEGYKSEYLTFEHRFSDKNKYKTLKRKFDEYQEEIDLSILSALNISEKYEVKGFDLTSIQSEIEKEITRVMWSNPNLRQGYCPPGSAEVKATYGSYTKSRASFQANEGLQEECTTGRCIGCYVNLGTDCVCVYQDLLCLCEAVGCAC